MSTAWLRTTRELHDGVFVSSLVELDDAFHALDLVRVIVDVHHHRLAPLAFGLMSPLLEEDLYTAPECCIVHI